MNSTTKYLDKLLTNAISLVKTGQYTDQAVMDIYSEPNGNKCEVSRNLDGTFNVEVSVPQADGIGRDLMMERNIQQ